MPDYLKVIEDLNRPAAKSTYGNFIQGLEAGSLPPPSQDILNMQPAVQPSVSHETIPRTAGDKKRISEQQQVQQLAEQAKSPQEMQQLGMNILNPYAKPTGERRVGEAKEQAEAFAKPAKTALEGVPQLNVPTSDQRPEEIKLALKRNPQYIQAVIREQQGDYGHLLSDKPQDVAKIQEWRQGEFDKLNARYPGIVQEALAEYDAENKASEASAAKHPVAHGLGTLVGETPKFVMSGVLGKQLGANIPASKFASAVGTGIADMGAWGLVENADPEEIENYMKFGAGMGATVAALPTVWKKGSNFKKQRKIAKDLQKNGVSKDISHKLSKQYMKGNISLQELIVNAADSPTQLLEGARYKELVSPLGGKPAKLVEGRKTLRGKARGSFTGKEAEITKLAEEGTGVHEAFHYFKENAASKKLYNRALKEIPKEIQRKGDIAMEEFLANKFANYRLGKETATGKIKTFFGDMVSKARGNAKTSELFKAFEAGKLGKGIPGQMKYQEIIEAPKDYVDKLFKKYSYDASVKPEIVQKALAKKSKGLTRQTFAAGKKAKKAEIVTKTTAKAQRAKAESIIKKYSPQNVRKMQYKKVIPVDTAEAVQKEMSNIAVTDISPRKEANLRILKDKFMRIEEAGKGNANTKAMLSEIENRLSKRSFKRMTNEELLAKKDTIDKLVKEGRRKMEIRKKVLKSQVEGATKQANYEMTSDIISGKKNYGKAMLKTNDSEAILRSEGLDGMIKGAQNIKANAILSHGNANSITTIMSNGNNNSAIRKATWNPGKAGRRRELEILDKVSVPYTEKQAAFLKVNGSPHKIDPRYGYTTNEKFVMLRMADNPEAAIKLYEGNPGITPGLVERMRRDLKPAEKALLDADRAFYKQWADEVKPLFRRIENKDFKAIENYFPIEYSPGQGFAYKDMAQSLLESRGIPYRDIDKSFGKMRSASSGKRIKLDFFGTAERHSEKMAKYVGYAEDYPKMKQVFNGMKSTITEQYGYDTTKFLEKWMNDLVTGVDRPIDAIERIGAKARSMTYGATLGLNPSIPINQVASYLNGVAEIGEKAMLKGTAYVNKANPSKAIKEMHNMSIFMKNRAWDMAMVDAKNAAKKGLGKSIGKIAEVQMKPIAAVDQWTTAQVFHGARLDWLAKHPNDIKGAIKFAEEAVEVSQPMTDVLFRTGVHRGGELSKQYGMYMTQVMQSWNKAMVNRVLKKAGKISGTKHMRNLIYATILPAAMVNVSRKLGFSDFASGTAKNLIGLVPGGSLATSISESRSAREIPGAILKAQAPLKAIRGVVQSIKDKGSMSEKMWKTLNSSMEAYLTIEGVGVPSIKRIVKGNIDYWSGEDRDPRRLLGKSRWQLGGKANPTSAKGKYKLAKSQRAALMRKLKAKNK